MRCVLAVSLLLTGCAAGLDVADHRTIHGVDPVFQPFIDQYIQYKGSPLSTDIPIQFADLPGIVAGVCSRWSTGERQIQVDRESWNYLNSTIELGDNFELIAHELGHCDLGRDHVETLDQYGEPISIMYPYVFTIYAGDLNYYMNELFHPASVTGYQPTSLEASDVIDIIVQ